MRVTVAFLLALTLLAGVAQPQGDKGKEVKRYGIVLDEERFPQSKPQEALKSVVKAINQKKIDYLLAHLADPKFVDGKVTELMKQFDPSGKKDAREFLAFQRLVKLTTEHFDDDPGKVKDLARFAMEEPMDNDKVAEFTLKNLPTRKVFMRKISGRWVLEDRER